MIGWIILSVWAIGVVWSWLPISRTLLRRLTADGGGVDVGDRVAMSAVGLCLAPMWPLVLLALWGAAQLADEDVETRR